jgi:hypothetical protein
MKPLEVKRRKCNYVGECFYRIGGPGTECHKKDAEERDRRLDPLMYDEKHRVFCEYAFRRHLQNNCIAQGLIAYLSVRKIKGTTMTTPSLLDEEEYNRMQAIEAEEDEEERLRLLLDEVPMTEPHPHCDHECVCWWYYDHKHSGSAAPCQSDKCHHRFRLDTTSAEQVLEELVNREDIRHAPNDIRIPLQQALERAIWYMKKLGELRQQEKKGGNP